MSPNGSAQRERHTRITQHLRQGSSIGGGAWARRIIVGMLFTVLCSAMTEAPAQAEASSVTVTVPGTHLTVTYPTTWVKASKAQVHAMAKQALFSAGNPQNGDNLVVNRFRGKLAYWYSSMREYRASAKLSAASSDGTLLSASKTKVGHFPAYRHVETYIDPTLKMRIVYGDIEIRVGHGSVVTFAVNLNADQPAARKTLNAILDSVKAA